IKEGKTVFITEGEKDADNVILRGEVATTTSIGASKGDLGKKWPSRFNKYFKDANVVLLPDNDAPGRAFMEHIAEQIKELANSVKILELPNLDEKGDVSDWFEDGNDIYDLLDLAKRTDEFVQ
ncbi:toprim domain-containing protein, partial [Arthrospira platensis SPKY2]